MTSIVGRLYVGHFDPVHKEPGAAQAAKTIFGNHDIVIGDFNASSHHLQHAGVIREGSFTHVDVPSYLPNISRARGRINIPRFDSVYAPKMTHRVTGSSLVVLPAAVDNVNPRTLMTTYRMDSDHVPVSAHIEDLATGQFINVVTYNVSDPTFWAIHYPSATSGFDEGGEAARQARIQRTIHRLMHTHTVIGLQEVPTPLASCLRDSLDGDWRMTGVQTHCRAAPDDPDRSLVVVLVAAAVSIE